MTDWTALASAARALDAMEQTVNAQQRREQARATVGQIADLFENSELREDFRMFRVDRIGDAEPDGTYSVARGRTLHDFLKRMAREHGDDGF